MAPTKDGTIDREGTSSRVAKPKACIVVLMNTCDVSTNSLQAQISLCTTTFQPSLASLYHQQIILGVLGLKI